MDKIGSLEIGHSHVKDKDFSIKREIVDDENVEVTFSHRHFFYAVYWIHEGNGTHTIDFEEYQIIPDRIFFIKPEQVHFLCTEGKMKYSALQFTEDFMIPYSADFQKQIPVYKDLKEDERIRISTLFNQIYQESVSNLVNSTAIIQSEIHTLLLELERIGINNSATSIIPDILNRYKSLIDSSFAKEHQVQYYAGQLGISPNYLNVLSKKHLNKSALEMINERLILEIKRLLLRTDNDISEIAYKLGFNELSYFSRFFKRHTGTTPNGFRIMMNKMYHK